MFPSKGSDTALNAFPFGLIVYRVYYLTCQCVGIHEIQHGTRAAYAVQYINFITKKSRLPVFFPSVIYYELGNQVA